MKKKILLLSILLSTNIVFSQVGINTQNPRGVLHIDGKKNNPSSGTVNSTLQQDDVVVDENGRVGIGTNQPEAKLDILSTSIGGGLSLRDGSQALNYVLTSDDAGNARWKIPGVKSIKGVLASSSSNDKLYFTTQQDVYINTGTSITLPPGTWKVETTQLLRPDSTSPDNVPNQQLSGSDYIFIRFTFTDNATSVAPMDGTNFDSGNIEFIAGSYSGPTVAGVPLKYGTITGSVIIKNTSLSAKTYYLLVGNTLASRSYKPTDVGTDGRVGTFYFWKLGTNAWRENRLTAIPLLE